MTKDNLIFVKKKMMSSVAAAQSRWVELALICTTTPLSHRAKGDAGTPVSKLVYLLSDNRAMKGLIIIIFIW